MARIPGSKIEANRQVLPNSITAVMPFFFLLKKRSFRPRPPHT